MVRGRSTTEDTEDTEDRQDNSSCSTYHKCLHYQLGVDGLHFQHQIRLPVVYQAIHLDAGYRIDFLVENCVIVELKAVEKLLPVHTAQLLTYLKLSDCQIGLLLNFNVPHLR